MAMCERSFTSTQSSVESSVQSTYERPPPLNPAASLQSTDALYPSAPELQYSSDVPLLFDSSPLSEAPIPNVQELIRDLYDHGERNNGNKQYAKGKTNGGRGQWRGASGGAGGECVSARHPEVDVEAVLTPDQRRPSDAQPPDWDEINSYQLPSGNGGGYGGGRRPQDPVEKERKQREEDERARFENELAVRGQLQDASCNLRKPLLQCPQLEAQEAAVRTRIVAIEDRINTLLHQPLGGEGLGLKKVWRMRPRSRIWADAVGDKRTTEVLKDSAAGVASAATSALRGTAQAVSAGASRVVSWSYKPALWTAAELASESVTLAAKGAYTAASSLAAGLYTGANTVVETLDEKTAEIELLRAELSLLCDELGAIDAKRSEATIRLLTPREGSVWYVNHACNVDWESTGDIRDVRISIARRMSALWSSTELARGVADSGSWSCIVPPTLDRGWYCITVEGPLGVPSVTSPYFLVQHEVPPLMLWVQDHRLHLHRGQVCLVHWSFRDDFTTAAAAAAAAGECTNPSYTLQRQHAAHPHLRAHAEASTTARASSAGGEEDEEEDGRSEHLSLANSRLLQWRVLADNLGTSGSFEWKVPDSCPQGTYYIQAKIKGAVVARCAALGASAGEGGLLGGWVGLGSIAAAEGGLLSPALRGAVRDDVRVEIGSRFFKYATIASDQPDSGSYYWKVPNNMPPGWYYLSISAAKSRVSVQSSWIELLPEEPEAPALASKAAPPPAAVGGGAPAYSPEGGGATAAGAEGGCGAEAGAGGAGAGGGAGGGAGAALGDLRMLGVGSSNSGGGGGRGGGGCVVDSWLRADAHAHAQAVDAHVNAVEAPSAPPQGAYFGVPC